MIMSYILFMLREHQCPCQSGSNDFSIREKTIRYDYDFAVHLPGYLTLLFAKRIPKRRRGIAFSLGFRAPGFLRAYRHSTFSD